MLLKILGWIWVISGIFFLLKPQRLRDSMKNKSVKKLRKFFFGLALALGILFIGAAWHVPGILGKIIIVLGVIGIFKAFFFLKAKAADKVIQWYVNQPLKFFRFSAVALIVVGAIILTA